MRILVTGANGFVGQAVCTNLLADGHEVYGAIRGDHLLPEGVHPRRIVSLGPNADWHEELEDIEAIVHAAARVHVMKDEERDPLAAFRAVNVEGTRRLAIQAATRGVKRLVFISSVKVNGEETFGQPFTEETPPAPIDAYGQSKWEAEQMLRHVAEDTGLEIVILRPPLIYGPGVKANLFSLLKAVDKGWPLPLGAVDNRRSLIGIDNFCEAIRLALTVQEAAGKTYLVRDYDDVSIAELIHRMARALDRPARLIHFPVSWLNLAGRVLGKRMMMQRLTGSLQIDDSRIRRELGYHPLIPLSDGLMKLAVWYRGLAEKP
jgi:nucleoside-diphosphate-sugar epimerase